MERGQLVSESPKRRHLLCWAGPGSQGEDENLGRGRRGGPGGREEPGSREGMCLRKLVPFLQAGVASSQQCGGIWAILGTCQ